MSNSVKIKKPFSPAEPTQPESQHGVALALTWEVLALERLASDEPPERATTDPRGYLLDLYAECLKAVKGERGS